MVFSLSSPRRMSTADCENLEVWLICMMAPMVAVEAEMMLENWAGGMPGANGDWFCCRFRKLPMPGGSGFLSAALLRVSVGYSFAAAANFSMEKPLASSGRPGVGVGSKAEGSTSLPRSTFVLLTIRMAPSSRMSISVCVREGYAEVFGFGDEEVPDELFLHLEVSEVLVDVVHGPDFVLLELDEVLHPDDLV